MIRTGRYELTVPGKRDQSATNAGAVPENDAGECSFSLVLSVASGALECAFRSRFWLSWRFWR
jgi:hypothetical protein